MGDILYAVTVLILLFFGIRLMANGWNLMTSEPYRKPEGRLIHPEMEDVPDGEELMVINFEEEEIDPLHASLQDRINQLQDDDDDDDGGSLVPAVR